MSIYKLIIQRECFSWYLEEATTKVTGHVIGVKCGLCLSPALQFKIVKNVLDQLWVFLPFTSYVSYYQMPKIFL